jgi:putative hydrolase of HD superfamily
MRCSLPASPDRLKHVERRAHLRPGGTSGGELGRALLERRAVACCCTGGRGPAGARHVLAMIAAHDLVEIEAGDTFAYDERTSADPGGSRARRRRCRVRQLPARISAARLRALVGGVRGGPTPGRPLRHGLRPRAGHPAGVLRDGHWREQGVSEARSRSRMDPAREVAPVFAALIDALYDRARRDGMFAP